MKNYHIFSLIEELFRFHSLSSTKDREIQTQTQSLVKFHINYPLPQITFPKNNPKAAERLQTTLKLKLFLYIVSGK